MRSIFSAGLFDLTVSDLLCWDEGGEKNIVSVPGSVDRSLLWGCGKRERGRRRHYRS